ncbi:flagellar protein FliS [Paracoccaceae bacterium]|nr:flagellar protein FliS [Paracoccaceae bacterium]
MSLDNAVETYKNAENIYAKGIETPHGRIQIVFDVIEKNLEKLLSVHPKTDFVAYGKVLQGIVILSGSLDMDKGGQMADELNELYAYCEKTMKEYLESKNLEKLKEIESIIGGIADSWSKIGD